MKNLLKNERGATAVLFSICLTVFIGMAAFSNDVGLMLTARTQLQSAVDASVLAAASGLTVDQVTATQRGISISNSNTILEQPVIIQNSEITFLNATTVSVSANRNVNLYFSRLFGITNTQIMATATAEIVNLIGTKGLRPWAIPDIGWQYGAQVILKTGSTQGSSNPSFYNAVDFPPMNQGTPVTGASAYRDHIQNGYQGIVSVGDELQVEPGNMIGPTKQGVNQLISLDANAYWDGNEIAGSAFPGFSSPRIIKIIFHDPNFPPSPGRSSLIVDGLGAFFLEGMSGKDVIGRFIWIITNGVVGGVTSTSPSLWKVRLTE